MLFSSNISLVVFLARLWATWRQELNLCTSNISHVSVQFSRSVVSNSLQPHGLQHTMPPCPSPTPGVYSDSHPLSWWCHPTISSSVIPSPPAFNLFSVRVFSNESALYIMWPKYWSFSFSISPSNEYSGLISFRIDWFDLLAVQETLRVFSNTTVQKHQFFGINLKTWSHAY